MRRVRELIGSGTLFQSAALMLGDALAFLELTLIPDYRGFLLAILPPGGFIALGFLLAGKRLLERGNKPKETMNHANQRESDCLRPGEYSRRFA